MTTENALRLALAAAISACPGLDENGYICTKDAAIKAVNATLAATQEWPRDMTTDNALRRALAALKPFADAYPQDGYLSPVRLIYSDGSKGSLAVEDFGDAHDTYEALTTPHDQPGSPEREDREKAAKRIASAIAGFIDAGNTRYAERGNVCKKAFDEMVAAFSDYASLRATPAPSADTSSERDAQS